MIHLLSRAGGSRRRPSRPRPRAWKQLSGVAAASSSPGEAGPSCRQQTPRGEEVQVPDGIHRARRRPAARLDRVVLRAGRRLQEGRRRRARSRARTTSCRRARPRRQPHRRSTPTRRPRAGRRRPTPRPPRARPSRRRACRASTRRSASASSSSGTRRRTASTASRAPNTGFVGPWEEGFLYGSAMIFLFVLAVGAFITVTMKTEAIQTGIGRLALRFRHSGSVLIAILMAVFALGGTTLRHVGGDARLLRPARPARPGAAATTGWSRRRSSSSAPGPA